ncbi:MAG TPA: UDP-N-acetylglucosamine--N-acetylmuramyl-(pentapeptide) pyrophosphoryl-undecaprenol N-acetylglucosamine transferase [Gemmatimonadaceae bacterium]|nr:UDP-N-acetylglucosamine--N-acetylmuramyl-(pentapeptide) pyrophosphoryl-undecaprenol N-acetylglucosamine transferase [Gemmatimonadaceae bacterium]
MSAERERVTVLFAGGGTGGHLYPGLAIARTLVKLEPRVRPYFIGAERGIEKQVLPTTEFPHLLLDLHPLYRSRPWQNWKTLLGGVSAWRAVAALAAREHPRLVVGTGGYAAGVALAYAVAHRIPIVQQAGDSHPGLTARAFRRWTRETYLAFPEAAKILGGDPAQLVDTGAPIERPPVPRPDRAAARVAWGFPPVGGHVLLIYGGSQGSRAMNLVVADWVKRGLPDDLHLIWMTGKASYPEFASLDGGRVRVREYLAPIADAYAAADLALVRAGAMTTAELFAWGIPAIVVPLPTAAADHQTHNARALQAAGAALFVPQSELTTDRLDGAVRALLADPTAMSRLSAGAAARARPDAAETIARRILTLLDLHQIRS